jgi:8-amino-7-oxononanoate synthase
LIAAVVRAALRISASGDGLRDELRARIAAAGALFGRLGAPCHGSPIFPLVLGGDVQTMAVAARLQAAGFDVRGIRPPTVPEGTSRLRIVITRNAGLDDIAALADALTGALA